MRLFGIVQTAFSKSTSSQVASISSLLRTSVSRIRRSARRMVGGLYGVALGGAFFGESMFSTETDASKIALIHLCARLIRGGFTLLDTQFVTDHLRQFGTIEVERPEFHAALEKALPIVTDYKRLRADATPQEIIDIIEAARKPQADEV